MKKSRVLGNVFKLGTVWYQIEENDEKIVKLYGRLLFQTLSL